MFSSVLCSYLLTSIQYEHYQPYFSDLKRVCSLFFPSHKHIACCHWVNSTFPPCLKIGHCHLYFVFCFLICHIVTHHNNQSFSISHRISDQSIASMAVNKTGDWVALGCRGMGQLLVWEWQSESYILKQQSHHNNMSCVAYSSDGHNLATGGDDGKVNIKGDSTNFNCFIKRDNKSHRC